MSTAPITTRRVPAWAMAAGALVLASWVGMLAIPMTHEITAVAAGWVLMVIAMMVPTVARPMMRISGGSGARAFAFMSGYVLAWTLSLPAAALIMRAPYWSTTSALVLWVAVGFYQLLPSTARNLRRCRSLDATASAGMLGIRQGIACMIACLPMMLAVMISIMVWNTAIMVTALIVLAACVFMIWEKSPSVPRAAIRGSGIAIVVLSVIAFVAGMGMGPAGSVHDSSTHAMGVSRS
jgi:Predicted metal-binding integral membrane protein (DUF2182)